jgi:hypothetical protein
MVPANEEIAGELKLGMVAGVDAAAAAEGTSADRPAAARVPAVGVALPFAGAAEPVEPVEPLPDPVVVGANDCSSW